MSFKEKFTEFIRVAVEGNYDEESNTKKGKDDEVFEDRVKQRKDNDKREEYEEGNEDGNRQQYNNNHETEHVDDIGENQYNGTKDKVVDIHEYQNDTSNENEDYPTDSEQDNVEIVYQPIRKTNAQKLVNHLTRPNHRGDENVKRVKRTVYMGLPIEYDMRRNISHRLEVDTELGVIVNMESREPTKLNATISSEYIIDNVSGEIIFFENGEDRYSDGLKYLIQISKERGISDEVLRELGTKINVLISRRDLRKTPNLNINGRDYSQEVDGLFKKLGIVK